jgi:hypothetical protein
MKRNSYYSDFYYPKTVTPLSDYRLKVTFENGETKIFDVKPYLKDDFWKPLNDKALFESVYVDGSIAWSENLDIAPEEVWHKSH